MAIDTETMDRIREALSGAQGVDEQRIEVAADGGEVVLRGAVASVEEASVAVMVAERHVEQVRNELAVDPNLREDAAGAGLVDPTDASPAEGLDDPARATEFATEEMGGEITDDVAESLGENVAWEPPHEPVGVPTVAEERGVPDHEVGAVESQNPGPLDEEEADATTPSAPDLSAAQLRRRARGGTGGGGNGGD